MRPVGRVLTSATLNTGRLKSGQQEFVDVDVFTIFRAG